MELLKNIKLTPEEIQIILIKAYKKTYNMGHGGWNVPLKDWSINSKDILYKISNASSNELASEIAHLLSWDMAQHFMDFTEKMIEEKKFKQDFLKAIS